MVKARLFGLLLALNTVTANHFSQSLLGRYRHSNKFTDMNPLVAKRHANDSDSDSAIASSPARYGHAAAYIYENDTLLLVGGQVSPDGTYITNDMVGINMSLAYTTSDSPFQAALPVSVKNKDLPPVAWAAASRDHLGKVWLIGGVTRDCETDPPAVVVDGANSTWTSVSPAHPAPPRRRQARSVHVYNETTNESKIYVWGGIADAFTCSLDTVGYLGLDVWDTVTHKVATYSWDTLSKGAVNATYKPPITDYVSVLLSDGKRIAYIGGQVAHGDLADMNEILILDTVSLTFYVQEICDVTGQHPASRMGHAAARLDQDLILIHGGLDKNGSYAKGSWVLDTNTWQWSILPTTATSLDGPRRAWHTMSHAPQGVIVLAYGLDMETGNVSDTIVFLSGGTQGWTWSHSWTPSVENPKQKEDGTTSTAPIQQQASSSSHTIVAHTIHTTHVKSPVTASVIASTKSVSLYMSHAPSATTTSSTNGTNNGGNNNNDGSDGTSTSTIVATAVGSICAFALVVGGATYIAKRRANARDDVLQPPTTTQVDGSSSAGKGYLRPVSELLFARSLLKRNLSLASTIHSNSDQNSFRLLSARGGRPEHNVGQVDGAVSPRTFSSAISYPYLMAVAMAHSPSQDSQQSLDEDEPSLYTHTTSPTVTDVDRTAGTPSSPTSPEDDMVSPLSMLLEDVLESPESDAASSSETIANPFDDSHKVSEQ